MKEYSAGDLTERIELQSKVRTPDGVGGATTDWTTYATVWAMVRPMTGRELENAMRAEGKANYLVAIRNRTDVQETHRAKWRDRYLNLRFIKRAGARSLWLEIDAELGASA
jgi:SPP1 family predicted phage head-tail adaptor